MRGSFSGVRGEQRSVKDMMYASTNKWMMITAR